eukprot:401828-Amorphochlora_amoeboformis.AAC.1
MSNSLDRKCQYQTVLPVPVRPMLQRRHSAMYFPYKLLLGERHVPARACCAHYARNYPDDDDDENGLRHCLGVRDRSFWDEGYGSDEAYR